MADVEEEPVAVAPEEVVEEEPINEMAADEEEDFVAVGGATEVKLFGKWSYDEIEVRDISLVVRK
jgi:small subunit ribosomal protein S5e